MTNQNPVVNAIVQSARKYGVDPKAALAVASVEGGLRYGAVGDQGTSYGPFQLHVGGALPQGRNSTWANSTAGIDYALSRIGSVARGLTGRAAVDAIVRKFERPAAPDAEVNKAWGRYGSSAPEPVWYPPSSDGNGGVGPLRPPQNNALLQSVLASGDTILGLPTLNFPLNLSTPTATAQQPVQQVKAPKISGRTVKFLESFAAPYGLTITSTTGGKHAKNSFHYRGRAVDFGGSPERLAALANDALHRGGEFTELIYTGPGNPGYSILKGKVIPNSQLSPALAAEHRTHVHLAR